MKAPDIDGAHDEAHYRDDTLIGQAESGVLGASRPRFHRDRRDRRIKVPPRRIPAALRCCPVCGHVLGHDELKLALVDRLVHVIRLDPDRALEAVRVCFPDDTDAASAQAGRKGGLLTQADKSHGNKSGRSRAAAKDGKFASGGILT